MSVPYVIEQTHRGEQSYDIYSRLLKDRIVFLGSDIDRYFANLIIAQLLFLEADNSESDINLYINSAGGSVLDSLAIYDTMQFIKAPIQTICVGQASHIAAILLAAGTKGKRTALKHSSIVLHQPIGGVGGQAADIELQSKEVQRRKQLLIEILSQHTGKSSKILRDRMERNFFLNAQEAKKFGLVDNVMDKKQIFWPMNMETNVEEKYRCSFCGKSQDDVTKIIAGSDVYICDECIALCSDIVFRERQKDAALANAVKLLKPAEIKSKLDQYVISQTHTKEVLAVAVYNHYKKINHKGQTDDIDLQKSNILMIGPSGSGKTLLAETLAKMLKVPFTIADATTLTEAGYVGEDVETILLKLLQAADFDVEKARNGIVYIDEIDKITRKTEHVSLTRDVSGEGVQQALLKVMEGTVANIPPQGGRKHPNHDYVQLDTSDILFIVGGAFVGLEEIINQRVGRKNIGFHSDKGGSTADQPAAFTQVESEDLLKFGLIPEFIGRLPIVTCLNELSQLDMLKILTTPKNSLVRQYEALVKMEGVELSFQQAALTAIAEIAHSKKNRCPQFALGNGEDNVADNV